jgi:hypothetical protein
MEDTLEGHTNTNLVHCGHCGKWINVHELHAVAKGITGELIECCDDTCKSKFEKMIRSLTHANN